MNFLKNAVELSESFRRDTKPKISTKELPVGLYRPQKKRAIRHYLRDCRERQEYDKNALFSELVVKKAQDCPSHSERSQKSTISSRDTQYSSASRLTNKPTTDRISRIKSHSG